MRKIFLAGLAISIAAGAAAAQQEGPKTPDTSAIYCSGVKTTEAVPHDTYVISGEQSNYKVTFAQGDLVYINKGSSLGAKVGDEFLVLRPVRERLEVPWSKWQPSLVRAMGTTYMDIGRLRVVNVQPKASLVEIVFSCDYMQRGDYVQAVAARPVPQFKDSSKFDRFAPPSGKKAGMIAETKNFGQVAATDSIVYVNLGASQGVKVGDYFRIFRYQGKEREVPYHTAGTAYQIYGFGSTPVRYTADDLPREILGEGIVVRVGPHAASVMITLSLREIYVGDYVEIE